MIKSIGVIGAGFSFPAHRLPLSHPFDTAAVIAGELNHLKFSGHSVRYVASDEAGTDAIATTLGEAIGRPGLNWVKFTNQQLLMGMIQAGIPDFLATEYVEMSNALDSGKLTEEYWKHRPELGQVKLETFAKMFAAAWNGT